MALESYEYRDPGEVVACVLDRYSVQPGDTILALVSDPPGAQEIVHVTRIGRAEWDEADRNALSTLLRDQVEVMPIPDVRPPRHSVATIAFRQGLAVFGRAEAFWLNAWMYSNHLRSVYSGGMVLVTEHGWTDFMSRLGGYQPRLTATTD